MLKGILAWQWQRRGRRENRKRSLTEQPEVFYQVKSAIKATNF